MKVLRTNDHKSTFCISVDVLRFNGKEARESIPITAFFDRQKEIFKSIAEKGMENPILIDNGFNIQSGGCRARYALENDYSHIEAIITKDLTEIKKIQKQQVEDEYKLIPEKYIYKHILEDEHA